MSVGTADRLAVLFDSGKGALGVVFVLGVVPDDGLVALEQVAHAEQLFIRGRDDDGLLLQLLAVLAVDLDRAGAVGIAGQLHDADLVR